MDFSAPAKINLYLNVIGKRPDGYHEIETLFERITLFDRITVDSSSSPTTIETSDPSIPTGEESLLGKTLSLFKKSSGIENDYKIYIDKRIPVGAGLGGGSSDAASLLKGLNEFSGRVLKEERLMEIARMLGADVPFFLEEASFCIGKERGDKVERVDSELKIAHILVNPPFRVSTKSVYGSVEPFGLTKEGPLDRMFTAFLEKEDILGIAQNLRNDLQTVVLREFPVLDRVFFALRELGSIGELLSGSGPTVFGIFDDEKAPEALEEVKKFFTQEEGWRVYLAHTY